MVRRVAFRLTGLVHGVNLRHAIRIWALGNQLSGFAKNEADGSVSVELQGERELLQRAYDWLRLSPGASRVDSCDMTWLSPVGDAGQFLVR